MNLLGPHIHRICDLRFDIMFSSSLPSFPFDFHGSATILRHLELRCRKDDGGPDNSTSVALSRTEHKEFECPRLKSLVIDGRNYYEARRRDARWTDKISRVLTLTISHFKPRQGESLSSNQLLLPLATINVRDLRITDLILRPSPQHLAIPGLGGIYSLSFDDVHNSRVTEEIIRLLTGLSDISLTRCTFGGITDTFSPFNAQVVEFWLSLEGIMITTIWLPFSAVVIIRIWVSKIVQASMIKSST
jgi:hypothetical protein